MGNDFPKHENGKAPRKGKKQPQVPEPSQPVVVMGPQENGASIQHDINHVAGMSGIETSLDWIARGIAALTSDDGAVSLTSGRCVPLKITLAENDDEDTMDRLVTAFERIADSVSKLAGLNRPRLESWHEQDVYTPRYKEIAVDGGKPGPAQP